MNSEGRIVEKIIVTGGQKLRGIVKVEGAKNAVLPILAASLLASKNHNIIKDVPNLADVHTINEVLKSLNANVEYNVDKNEIHINAEKDYRVKLNLNLLVKCALQFL